MIKIYIDSDVFRLLKNNHQYDGLKNKLIAKMNNLIYFFSSAHIDDLSRDKTDKKYDDLEFMETFVGSNYLNLPYKEEYVCINKYTPIDAYNSRSSIKDNPFDVFKNLDSLFDEDFLEKSPEAKFLLDSFKNLLNSPLPLNLKSNIDKHGDEAKKGLEILLYDIKDNYTFSEWIDQVSNMYITLNQDKSAYKNLRKFSIDNLKLVEKYDIDISEIDFNEEFKDTPIQKSFIEYVDNAMSYNKSQESKEFRFFITAYNLMNILGIDEEPNKNVKFQNTITDAQHAYFAANCDFLISADKGMRHKARVLYKLLEIETIVLGPEEFEKSLWQISVDSPLSFEAYFKTLLYDLNNSIIIQQKKLIDKDRQVIIFKPSQLHFGYFNRFSLIIDSNKDNLYYFHRYVKNYSRMISYEEISAVIDKAVTIFGTDLYFREYYSEKDTEEIRKNVWKGRTWEINNTRFVIEFNSGSDEFCYIVKIKD